MEFKKLFLITLILCLFIIPITVNAETVTGTLTGSNITQKQESTASTGALTWISAITINEIQYSTGLVSLICFTSGVDTYDAGAPNGATTPVTVRMASGDIIGTGTLGFQRLFNGGGAEQTGYVWIYFNSWNITGRTGDPPLFLNYTRSALYNITTHYVGGTGLPSTLGLPIISTGYPIGYSGTHLATYLFDFSNSYIVNKPAELGINGTIIKGNNNSRVWVIDGDSNIVKANENTVNSNQYSFTVNSQTIKLSIQDSSLNWYNTSVLFTNTTSPTPTPTPTTTPPSIRTYYNATFYIKNGNNNTAVSNAYVQLSINPSSSSNPQIQGYTDGSGIIHFNLVEVHPNQKLEVWKSGFQYASFVINAQYDSTWIMYIYPDVGGIPSQPPTFNLTIQVKDSQGNTPVNSAYVSAGDSIAGTPIQAQYTNASGYVVFQNFPTTAYINGQISKSGYISRYWDIGYLPTEPNIALIEYIQPTGIVITPTITPVQFDTWSLTASPNSINAGSSVALSATCSNASKQVYPTAQMALWYMVTPVGSPLNPKLIGEYKYNTSRSYWDFRIDENKQWDVTGTSYNPMKLNDIPTITGTYTYIIIVEGAGLATQTQIGSASTTVLVSGGLGGSLTMELSASDIYIHHLQDFDLVLTNKVTGSVVEYDNVYDHIDVPLTRGTPMNLAGHKEGYINNSIDFTVPLDPSITDGSYGAVVFVKLTPENVITTGNTSVTVYVSDKETFFPIPNVAVYMTGYSAPKFSGTSGESVTFVVPQNTTFTATGIKDGYCSATQTKNTSSNIYLMVDLYLKYGSCIGVTPTHTPIPNATGTPTPKITPIHMGNQTITTCNRNITLFSSNVSYVDRGLNEVACAGFNDENQQKLALACFIIIVFGLIFGKVAGGAGILAGVGIGVIIAIAAGVLDAWIFFAFIIIAALLIGAKIFLSSGDQ
jgi:hypothetical protein